MPWFRCTDTDCGHRWSHNSVLDDTPECQECGEATEVFDPDDEFVQSGTDTGKSAQPRVTYARELARRHVTDAGVTAPPVPVPEMAEAVGLTIALRRNLGTLRGRLVGNSIELAKSDPLVVQRFTIAHELGHRALQHNHGDGDWAEAEADQYANELLVPGPLLRKELETTKSAAALRRTFNVSRPVLEIAAKHHRCSGQLTY